jgi:PAS domain S-box-containing protein
MDRGRVVRTGAPAARGDEDGLIELIERAPEGIFIADLEGRFIEVNRAGCEMVRYPRDEILGKTIVDFLRPEDVGRLWERRDQLLAGDSSCVEWVIRCGDGTELPIEATSVILSGGRWVGFLRDISPRRELEAQVAQNGAQLTAERNFLDALLDTAAALIVVGDENARIVRFNKACEEVAGYPAADMLGTTRWQEIVPPEEQSGVAEMMDRLKAGEELVERENHWLRRDGSRRLIRWRNKALRDAAGSVRFLVSVGNDVTDWYRAEAEARQHLEEASRLQRLQTANELATMLAHELNQPLAAITAYAEAAVQLVRQPSPDCHRVTMILERISRQALRAGEAIRRLRTFIARERPDAVPLDLNAVVRDACALAAPRARSAGVGLTLELDEGLTAVMGIDVYTEQVLLNLINNALDAIGRADMDGGQIVVTTRRSAGFAQVSVRDTGPGIDEQTAAMLFDPFFTLKADGLGVGLKISHSLVEAQGGRLWVTPQVPGAILHFSLPLAP